MRKIITYFFAALLVVFINPQSGFCYKPKTHLYLALKTIEPILQGSNTIEMGGLKYEIDADMAAAVRKYPGYYLGGVVGPDGFPDIMFGQMIVHPDSKCKMENGKWTCNASTENESWSWEWFDHLHNAAKKLTGEEREKALAFVTGYITHGAGDMWAHTFVNYFARGSWPDNLDSTDNKNIAIRHIIVEGVIGNYTPAIKDKIAALGGIQAPLNFIVQQFFYDPWAKKRSAKSLAGSFLKLKEELIKKREEKKYFVVKPYLNCWIEEIDKGLQDWPAVSLRVAEELFINEEIDSALRHISDFENEHLYKMLSIDPISLIASCNGHPDFNIPKIMGDLANSLSNLPGLKKLRELKGNLRNFLFEKVFGVSIDSLKNYLRDPERYLDPAQGFFAEGDREKILELISIDSSTRLFNENSFAIVHNTIQTSKLVFLKPAVLDKMLFDFNAGPLYATSSDSSSKNENVMLGFIRSLDGNHQWRSVSPPLPVREPSREFSDEMPIWKDCLSRANFFKKIFYDWTVSGISIPFYEPDECSNLSKLAPVTAAYTILPAVKNEEIHSYSSCGEQQFLEVALVNHQRVAQNYSLYITYEVSDSVTINPGTHAADLIPDRLCAKTTSLVTASQLKYYKDSCLLSSTPVSVIYQEIINGILPATTGTVATSVIKIPLLRYLGGAYKLNVYLLEKMNSPELPVLNSTKNSLIKNNEAEYLTSPVNAFFTANLFITCEDCTGLEGMPCLQGIIKK